jgi:hypothetical protein
MQAVQISSDTLNYRTKKGEGQVENHCILSEVAVPFSSLAPPPTRKRGVLFWGTCWLEIRLYSAFFRVSPRLLWRLSRFVDAGVERVGRKVLAILLDRELRGGQLARQRAVV